MSFLQALASPLSLTKVKVPRTRLILAALIAFALPANAAHLRHGR